MVAADDEINAVADEIGRALCPDPSHVGPCKNPWEMRTTPAEDVLTTDEVSEVLAGLLPPGSSEA